MITRSHCPRGAALRGYKYSSLLFAPGTINPLISDLAWIKPQAHRKVGRQPGPPHATLSPCLTPSPETECGIMQPSYCMPRPSLGLQSRHR